uniref:Uncharacterized protein n=1 Tax=Arundo donax TaxID=35708 RepID=A0A0A9A6C5_ARUDO
MVHHWHFPTVTTQILCLNDALFRSGKREQRN